MPFTIDRPSPVPCPAPLVVKNGSKSAGARLGVHADAGVAHGEPDVGAGLAAGDLARRASVATAVSMVRMPPSGIASRAFSERFSSTCSIWVASARIRPTPGVRRSMHSTRWPEQAPEQRRGADDDVVQVQRPGLRALVAPDRQQVRREIGRVLAGFADLAGIAQRRGRIGQRLDQGVAPAHDRRQHVVEVVGDAGGEVADRLRLLRLLQLPFELAAIGDVAGEHQLAPDAAGVDEAGGGRHHHPPPAVAAADAELRRRLRPGARPAWRSRRRASARRRRGRRDGRTRAPTGRRTRPADSRASARRPTRPR